MLVCVADETDLVPPPTQDLVNTSANTVPFVNPQVRQILLTAPCCYADVHVCCISPDNALCTCRCFVLVAPSLYTYSICSPQVEMYKRIPIKIRQLENKNFASGRLYTLGEKIARYSRMMDNTTREMDAMVSQYARRCAVLLAGVYITLAAVKHTHIAVRAWSHCMLLSLSFAAGQDIGVPHAAWQCHQEVPVCTAEPRSQISVPPASD